MQPFDRFLIAPMATGLEKDLESWLLPEDAYSRLENALVFRGRLKKRFGYRILGDPGSALPQLNTRLRINLGTTDINGDLSVTVPGSIFKIGQMFSLLSGSDFTIFTVNATGAPAAMLVNTSGTGTATYNTTTGALVVTGSYASTDVFFYPAEPVMGLISRELNTINKEETLAFDTQFAYRFTGAWNRVGTNSPAPAAGIWSGDNTNFFWGTNYRGDEPYNTYFYVTNFNRADLIQYLPQGSSTWNTLQPTINSSGDTLDSCRVLLPYKDRLVALHTLENDGSDRTFPNRCRFSQNGNPVNETDGWLDDTPGRGGFIDAPTKEEIISAEFIKDRLIVFFERSTWELVYTANEILPFRWQQINTELGCESTFSRVPFDKAILTVGNVGVHACNGVNVERIDQKIPDEVFKIHNGNNGPQRVYGIRDYYSELVYWSFPSEDMNPTYPDRVLLYNYQNQTWAFYRDTFTCFGFFQKSDDISWATLPYATWAEWTAPWSTGAFQSDFLDIIAGNQQGWTVILERDAGANDQFYYVTDISGATFTVIDHNFAPGDYFLIQNAEGVTGVNDEVATVVSVTDEDTIVLDVTATGTYTGGATLQRISNIDILTKKYNPYIKEGKKCYIPYVDFLVQKTSNGAFNIDNYIDESSYSTEDNNTGALLGNNTLSTAPYALVPFESEQEKLWHRFFVNNVGFNVQMRFFLTDEQIRDTDISLSDFIIHGFILYAEREGRV